ncbi:outer membrane protein assembly factor BamB family protein [Hamadaea tsunoensis]|uniref:outer membrane protein assembly factor BamB family protein n=1 Tax=Hamadaea tsunoensis TaxID=53368 RepID=UPI0003FF2A27|nr:PQQ-binding-like beta-propeller repeat protein [Hamadaea tsunoensis]
MILVLGIAVALIRAKRPEQPARPVPTPSYTNLHGIGEPIPATGFVQSLITGGYAFVAAIDHEVAAVTALDAATGRRLWTHALDGRRLGHPYLHLMDGHLILNDLITTGSGGMTEHVEVLDPASGATRWRHDLGQRDHAYVTDGVYLAVGPDNALTGFDWNTGEVRWGLPAGPKLIYEIADRSGGGIDADHGILDYLHGASHFYRAETGGTIREYNLADGRPTGHSWTGAPAAIPDDSFAYHGKLYLVSTERLSTFDLGGDGPSVAYAILPPTPGFHTANLLLPSVLPCAGDAICLRAGLKVVLLRAGATPVVQDMATFDFVLPVGDTIYLYNGPIFDRDLRPILPAEVGATTTVGVDDGRAVLALDETQGQPDDTTRAMKLWLFDPATGKVVGLGGLPSKPHAMVVGQRRLIAVTTDTATLYAY